jgi:uncharacterized surface protein with fasciclin (FAS1) repeats
MKKITIILGICAVILGNLSCDEEAIEIAFKDVEKLTIYDYIIENQDEYSSFLKILEAGNLDKTLSAYNRENDGYTLFLPNNDAIDAFVAGSDYASLDELLNDEAYVRTFCRFHVVNDKIDANEFPFGALPELTLSEDFLTVGIVIQPDTSYYMINNQAPVIRPNIELSNGYIHLVGAALEPITLTTYEWLSQRDGFTVFKAAVDATGLDELLSLNVKNDPDALPFTLLMEPDSIYNKRGIFNLTDLANTISPGRTDYTDPLNPLYNYVAYHVLTDKRFLSDYQDDENPVSTNYATYSDIPLHIDGTGIDIKINKNKEIFDTIIRGNDSTFVNYVGILYDASNVMTQSGVIHFIDQVMKQQAPSKATQTYEFSNEHFFDDYRLETGSYLIDAQDSTLLDVISYSGSDLFYVLMEEAAGLTMPWSNDFIMLDGDFIISYTIPKLVQGNYRVYLQADTYNDLNAVIEVFIDGKPIGGSVDLANTGSPTASAPFVQIELGTMNFLRYQEHNIQIRSLIPGSFSWDYIRFEPI